MNRRNVTTKEIVKRLKKEGWFNIKGNGGHMKFKHKDHKFPIIVSNSKKGLSPTRSLKKMFLLLNWEW